MVSPYHESWKSLPNLSCWVQPYIQIKSNFFFAFLPNFGYFCQNVILKIIYFSTESEEVARYKPFLSARVLIGSKVVTNITVVTRMQTVEERILLYTNLFEFVKLCNRLNHFTFEFVPRTIQDWVSCWKKERMAANGVLTHFSITSHTDTWRLKQNMITCFWSSDKTFKNKILPLSYEIQVCHCLKKPLLCRLHLRYMTKNMFIW